MAKKLYANGVTGDVAIYEAGNDDLPLTNPLGNLGRVYFHSALDYMSIVSTWTGTISHPLRSQSGATDKYNPGVSKPLNGVQDYVLFNHGQGAVRPGIAKVGNDMLPAMASVQKAGLASNRFATLIINGTSVILRENWFTFNDNLPAFAQTYTVYLFGPPIVPSGNKTLYITPTQMIASRGKLDTARRYIRSNPASPDFYLGRGATADVSGGGLRIVTPAGAVQNDDRYNGSFGGTTAKGVSV